MYFSKHLKSSYLYVILLLVFVTWCLAERAMCRVFHGDEVFYLFQYATGHKRTILTDYATRPMIHNIHEGLLSGYYHYLGLNGRLLIHTAIYIIPGVFGMNWMYFINGAMFIALVIGLVRLCIQPAKRTLFCLWLIILSILLYAFPSQTSIWTSINLAPNYLWPSTAVVWFLIYWFRASDHSFNWWQWLLLIPLSFVTGCSHEVFCTPLGVALTGWMIANRRVLKTSHYILYIVFGIGAAICVFSPGNLRRASGPSHAIDYVTLLTHSYTFMFLCITLLGLAIYRRKYLQTILRCNYLYILALIVNLIFTYFFRTNQTSFVMGDLMCSIILFKLIGKYITQDKRPHLQRSICLILLPLFIVTQVSAVVGVKKYEAAVQLLVDRLKQSPSGVCELPEFTAPLCDYLNHEPITERYGMFDDTIKWSSIQILPQIFDRRFIALNTIDYRAVSAPETYYIPTNRLPGSEPLYSAEGSVFMWVHPDSISSIKHIHKFEEIRIHNRRFIRAQAFRFN